MARFHIDLATNGGADFRDLSRQLRQADPLLRRKLLQNIRKEGKPVLTELKAAVKATPGGKSGSTGLRKGIARNTKLQVRAAGIRFRTTPLAGSRRRLHIKLEGLERWRHPTFGHDPWVPQDSHPWFYPTVSGRGPQFRRGVVRAIDEVIEELGG